VHKAPRVTVPITADLPFSTTVHALADLERRAPDHDDVCTAFVEAEAALAAFAAMLDDPLADIDPLARRAYLAALVLRATLATLPGDRAAQLATADRMLDTFEPFVRRVANSDRLCGEATSGANGR
jgi:hypothetical protein